MTFPGNTVSNVIYHFTFGEHLFIVGSTIIATIAGYSIAYPRRVKGAAGFANAVIAGTGAFIACYVKSDTRLTLRWHSDLEKERKYVQKFHMK